ncbi:baculoviral IAP repeat-containing protein 3-like [Diabrotica virgifera virgifera]|uniref:Baculoviral IAP repeat-containing protein 3-like n=1 Tax=Diabrotica virgifera virgifera TaxID=50390 RepID=A0ABM5ITX2_DIAVI|nr:baculoviral IAP repeat-containing protein 3-like [Diabrotica virgifera virgifera]
MCLEVFTLNVEDFYSRLSTFNNWKGKKSEIELAACGFYFLQVEDIVKCFKCGVEIYKWESNDNIIEDHKKFSPECTFLKRVYPIFSKINNNKETLSEKKINMPVPVKYKCPKCGGETEINNTNCMSCHKEYFKSKSGAKNVPSSIFVDM